jgi:hypothetical protein
MRCVCGGGRGSAEIVYILRPDQRANEEQASRQQRTQDLAHEFPIQPQTEDISRSGTSEVSKISVFFRLKDQWKKLLLS